jgi:PepSY-associated TM region
VFKVLLVLHRYLAVSVGLLMALWCLSGFVMMYQQYPTLTDAEQLQGLQPLRLDDCCHREFLPEAGEAGDFRIEMQAGAPVLRERGSAPFDLASGRPLRPASQLQILQIASDHAAGRGIRAKPRWLSEQGVDQWTLLSARPGQAIAHVALGDAAGTELYLNRDTGEVIQDTSRRERILTWFGAIPHWLYPLALRQNGPLWSRIVIWTSVIGVFLVATGLYVGIARWRRRDDGRRASPFRGWWYWHHIAGLAFGALALTWVFSGLLTMNPWGLLEGSDVASQVIPRLQGSPSVTEQRRFMEQAPAKLVDDGYLRLRSQPFGGKLFVLGDRPDGSSVRLDADGNAAPLTEPELRGALAKLEPPLSELSLLQTEDAYYYSHKQQREFPVWRAILGDEQRTRLYVSPVTGELHIVDADARKMRWLERGLHGLDFSGLRKRPLWDIVTLLLLAGVTAVTVTGAWMALQRIRKDLSRS